MCPVLHRNMLRGGKNSLKNSTGKSKQKRVFPSSYLRTELRGILMSQNIIWCKYHSSKMQLLLRVLVPDFLHYCCQTLTGQELLHEVLGCRSEWHLSLPWRSYWPSGTVSPKQIATIIMDVTHWARVSAKCSGLSHSVFLTATWREAMAFLISQRGKWGLSQEARSDKVSTQTWVSSASRLVIFLTRFHASGEQGAGGSSTPMPSARHWAGTQQGPNLPNCHLILWAPWSLPMALISFIHKVLGSRCEPSLWRGRGLTTKPARGQRSSTSWLPISCQESYL